MSIRLRIFIVFLVLSVCSVAGSAYLSSTRLLTDVDDLEKQTIRQHQTQIRHAIDREVRNLETKISDWSSWDDAYEFIDTLSPDFITSNMQSETFTNLNITHMVFVKKNTVRYSMSIDPDTHTQIGLPDDLAVFATSSALPRQIQESKQAATSGFILAGGVPYIVTAKNILRSSGEGDPNGLLVFAQRFSDDAVTGLNTLTQLTFTAMPYSKESLAGAEGKEMLEDAVKSDENHIHEISDSRIEADVVISDMYGKPALYIKNVEERHIHLQGVRMSRYVTFVSAATGLGFVIVVLTLLDIFIFRRLNTIGSDVRTISLSKDTSARVRVGKQHDEISVFADSVNTMLESLEESSKQIHEKNTEMESSQRAMLNILEDERELEDALKKEKEGIESKVQDRTKELENQKVRLLASINSLNMGYALTDVTGSILVANDRIHKLLDIPESAVSLAAIDVWFGEALSVTGRFVKCLEMKTAFLDESVSRGNRFFRVQMIPVTLDAEGKSNAIGVVLLIEDVTERKIVERSKDEFFSIASHELRTPLTAIRGNIAMIKDYYPDVLKDPSLAEMVDDMYDSSLRLIAIVNEFLDMSRLEMKKIEFKKDVFSLRDLVAECFVEFQGLMKEKKIVLTLDADADATAMARADKNKTKQIILNLLSNAFKFTEKGSISVSVRKDPAHGVCTVAVKDTGMGITETGKNLLFHKFQQTQENTLTRDMSRGTGLGLYISRLMVEGMGGSIWLEKTESGVGSVFAFSVPLA